MKVLAFTGGITSPSARFRVRQYIPALHRLGIDIEEVPSGWAGRNGQPVLASLLRALPPAGGALRAALGSWSHDATLFQRWMLSRFPTFEWTTRRPRILDVDDAIWLEGGIAATRALARLCRGVICGNQFLAERFLPWNRNIRIIPTAVDTERFAPLEPDARKKIICWSGSRTSLPYLAGIEHALSHVLQRHLDARLRVICNERPTLSRLRQCQLEYVPWSAGNEAAAISDCTVGVMPLEHSVWTRGKCSYKMLCYMSCGLPVVVTPVGMNTEVLAKGNVGVGARNVDEWVDALDMLLTHPSEEMSHAARSVAVMFYGLERWSQELAAALRSFVDS